MNPYTGAAAMNVGTEYRRVPAELFIGLRMELSLLSVGCFRTKATDLQHSAGMGRAELGGGSPGGAVLCLRMQPAQGAVWMLWIHGAVHLWNGFVSPSVEAGITSSDGEL